MLQQFLSVGARVDKWRSQQHCLQYAQLVLRGQMIVAVKDHLGLVRVYMDDDNVDITQSIIQIPQCKGLWTNGRLNTAYYGTLFQLREDVSLYSACFWDVMGNCGESRNIKVDRINDHLQSCGLLTLPMIEKDKTSNPRRDLFNMRQQVFWARKSSRFPQYQYLTSLWDSLVCGVLYRSDDNEQWYYYEC